MEKQIRIKYDKKTYALAPHQGFMSWDEMTAFKVNYCNDCNNKKSCQTFLKVDSAISLQREYWNSSCLIALKKLKSEAGLASRLTICSDFKPLNS